MSRRRRCSQPAGASGRGSRRRCGRGGRRHGSAGATGCGGGSEGLDLCLVQARDPALCVSMARAADLPAVQGGDGERQQDSGSFRMEGEVSVAWEPQRSGSSRCCSPRSGVWRGAVSKQKRVCRHDQIEHGRLYDYCTDCGAVRHAASAGRPAGEWHSCSLCRSVQ